MEQPAMNLSKYMEAINDAIKINDVTSLNSTLQKAASEEDLIELKDYCTQLLYEIPLFEKSLDCFVAILKFTGNPKNLTNKQGRTLLHLAAFYGDIHIVDELLQLEGIDVDQRTPSGCTALYLATPRGHFKVLNRLLCRGADANCVTKSGSTPLIVTAYYDHVSCADLLISYKANLNHQNSVGMTPMHVAAKLGHLKLYDLFLREGGNNYVVDMFGQTPEDLKRKSQYPPKLQCPKIIKLPGMKSREQSKEPGKKNDMSNIIGNIQTYYGPSSTEANPPPSQSGLSVNKLVKSSLTDKVDTSSTRSSHSNHVTSEHLYSQQLIFLKINIFYYLFNCKSV